MDLGRYSPRQGSAGWRIYGLRAVGEHDGFQPHAGVRRETT
jgi:hypothetical protein